MQSVHTAGPRKARHNVQRNSATANTTEINKLTRQDFMQAFQFLPQCYFYHMITSLSAPYVQNTVLYTLLGKGSISNSNIN